MNIPIGSVWENPKQTQRVKIIYAVSCDDCADGYHVAVLSERGDTNQPWKKVEKPRCECDIIDPRMWRWIKPSLSLAEEFMLDSFAMGYPIFGVYRLWTVVLQADLLPWEKNEGVFSACRISCLANYLDKALFNRCWKFNPYVGSEREVVAKIVGVICMPVLGCSPAIYVAVERSKSDEEFLIEVRPGTIFMPVSEDYREEVEEKKQFSITVTAFTNDKEVSELSEILCGTSWKIKVGSTSALTLKVGCVYWDQGRKSIIVVDSNSTTCAVEQLETATFTEV
ncbi:MAG TPA: hypothetical protein DIU29_03260 [Candidatus Jacksonbacteria bacterium]|nr:hypothetical protein [Candidatus Jacksonbacteria bacterium]HCR15222.1 hypothetical protein [Candidatus Jacksonbacteria bacterium]